MPSYRERASSRRGGNDERGRGGGREWDHCPDVSLSCFLSFLYLTFPPPFIRRARKLWEMENAELDRGARLRILESMVPAGEQQPSTALGTQAHLRNSCSAFSPNSRALWHTYSSMSMQAMSPSCFVDVHLLDNTPTKSSMVDL